MFYFNGVVQHEVLPRGQKVNDKYNLKVRHRLGEAIRRKRPDLRRNNSLHHDNAPEHALQLVREFLANTNAVIMPQSPYSPDLVPCDFFLVAENKNDFKGSASIDEIKSA